MPSAPSWLPAIVPYDSDWSKYVEILHTEYVKTYRTPPPLMYGGKKVTAPRLPEINGKSESFWHIIGGTGNTPEPGRCERINWARAIIEHHSDESVLVWEERGYRGRHQVNTLLWLKDHNYVVVLAKRNDYYLLRTAYVVKRHKKPDLQNSYNNTQKQTPPAKN
jgi:hypothetical protein